MTRFGDLNKRLRASVRLDPDADLAEELRFHLLMEASALEAQGLPPADAYREARRQFGGMDNYNEELRDVRGGRWIEALGQDARLALRLISLYVANRRREFGIRLAVGAAPGKLVQLVLREGVGLAIVGVAAGAGAALLATRWLRALLYEVKPNDPIVFALLAVSLLGVAAASCYLPARRAAKSDPLVALRSD
jgi:hypothetical protein